MSEVRKVGRRPAVWGIPRDHWKVLAKVLCGRSDVLARTSCAAKTLAKTFTGAKVLAGLGRVLGLLREVLAKSWPDFLDRFLYQYGTVVLLYLNV